MSGHHILANKTSRHVLIALLVLTFITVAVAQFDFGAFNFPIAMAIATSKALLVIFFFMALKYDTNENRVVFFSSFSLVLIFVVLTASDLFTRGDYRVVGPAIEEASGEMQFERPWEPSEELLAMGEEIYDQQCATCHGSEGRGDGPAGAALNPSPRDFHGPGEEWQRGRKPSQVYTVLTEGLGIMPAFPQLSREERWAVAHYVLDFGDEAPEDTEEDLMALGIDPEEGYEDVETAGPTIPVDFAIELYLEGE